MFYLANKYCSYFIDLYFILYYTMVILYKGLFSPFVISFNQFFRPIFFNE